MENPFKKSRYTFTYVLIGIFVLAIIFIAYGRSDRGLGSSASGPLAEFATCLKEAGATFYGTFWCPHCQNQKDMFGSAQGALPYVECSTADGRGQLPACANAGVEAYPTWVFGDGSRQLGTVQLSELAAKTGCSLPPQAS